MPKQQIASQTNALIYDSIRLYMLHTQITRSIKHKVVFIRKTPSTCFSLFFSTPFVVHELNKTCHALYI